MSDFDRDKIVIVGIFFGEPKTTHHTPQRRPQFVRAEGHMLAAQAVGQFAYDWAEAWQGGERLARVEDPRVRLKARTAA